MMAANYRHIGGGENRLVRHYSRFAGIWPTSFLADQSLTLRKSQNAGSNRPSRANQDLPVLRFSTKPGGEVAYCADRGVAGAFGKADLAQGRVALCDAGAETKFAAVATPSSNQLARRLAHRDRHLDGALRRVRTRHGIVEKHHDPVARELVECPLELANKRSQRAVVLAQKIENLFWFGGLSEGGVAAQIAENDDDLATMAFEDVFVTLRDD